ncbi:MAG: rRNA maturation RNase YbeY [Alphaproteobacteria bacterium]|nr:MAG: rRNA maturation RNase YbeY [Alphaproteobacteria bacterium]
MTGKPESKPDAAVAAGTGGEEGRPVEVIIEDERWEGLGIAALAGRAAEATLGHLGLDAARLSLSLLATTDARIARLNRDFRGKDSPTNVLSWPSVERRAAQPGMMPAPPAADEEELGDIALAWETCLREAREGGIAPAAHVTHLVVHGLLHLLGYDHEHDADAMLMEGLETAILAELGIADPYGIEAEAARPAIGGGGKRAARNMEGADGQRRSGAV